MISNNTFMRKLHNNILLIINKIGTVDNNYNSKT